MFLYSGRTVTAILIMILDGAALRAVRPAGFMGDFTEGPLATVEEDLVTEAVVVMVEAVVVVMGDNVHTNEIL
jgi:hypothetical protein